MLNDEATINAWIETRIYACQEVREFSENVFRVICERNIKDTDANVPPCNDKSSSKDPFSSERRYFVRLNKKKWTIIINLAASNLSTQARVKFSDVPLNVFRSSLFVSHFVRGSYRQDLP